MNFTSGIFSSKTLVSINIYAYIDHAYGLGALRCKD